MQPRIRDVRGGKKPVRLQLSRRKGFNLQSLSRATNGLDAVRVARPGIFGNPFTVGRDGDRATCVGRFRSALYAVGGTSPHVAPWVARVLANLGRIRGRNLGCYCRLGEQCHADVLLELANNAADVQAEIIPTKGIDT